MGRTKRTWNEEEGDPHRKPPKRPGKEVVVDARKKKKLKRRSADEQLIQEQADVVIGAHEAGCAGHPVRIAELEAAGSRQQPMRRVSRTSPVVATEEAETPPRRGA